METVDCGEAAPRAPQPASIQVHFHHESGLAKLLLGGCSLLQPLLLPRPRATSRTLGRHRLLATSWVSKAAGRKGHRLMPRLPRPGRGSPSPVAMHAPWQPLSEQEAKPVLSSNRKQPTEQSGGQASSSEGMMKSCLSPSPSSVRLLLSSGKA